MVFLDTLQRRKGSQVLNSKLYPIVVVEEGSQKVYQ